MKLSARAVARLSLCLLAATVAVLAAPLGRFPSHDLLWNDLYLMTKVAFAADAWRGHLFATLDFTQGFGNSIFGDHKGLAHLLDPAALFALVLPLPGAIIARTALLALLGAMGLAQVVTGGAISRLSASDFALVAAYFAVPQFFFETSLYFYGLFLCLPGLYWRLRCVVETPSVRSWLAFCAVAAVAIGVSDIHMVGFAPLFVAFALVMGAKAERRATVLAGSVLMLLTLLEYWPMLSEFGAATIQVPALLGPKSVPLNFANYSLWFVAFAVLSAIAPVFTIPVSLYVNPVLLAEFGGLVFSRERRTDASPLLLRARVIAVASGLLLFGGAAVYAVPSIRERLPSYLRYHIAFIPFMIVMVVASARAQATGGVATRGSTYGWRLVALTLAGAAVSAGAKLIFDVSSPYFSRFGVAYSQLSPLAKLMARLRTPLTHPEVLWPVLFAAICVIAFAVLSWRLLSEDRHRPTGTYGSTRSSVAMALACIAVLFSGMYAQSWAGGAAWRWYYDPALRQSLFRDLPSCVDSLTRRSSASGAPSLLPVAASMERRSDADHPLGHNDILMGVIELPDAFAARAAHQQRYGYSKANRLAYRALTGDTVRTWNFEHAQASRLRAPAEAAGRIGANILLVADTVLTDPSLTTLGSCHVPGEVPDNPSLVGDVTLYEVRTGGSDAFSRAQLEEVRRTFVRLRVQAPTVLPVAYSTSLRARDGAGKAVPLFEDSSGLARVEGPLTRSPSSQTLVINSRDGRRGYSLIGLVLCALMGSGVVVLNARSNRAPHREA